MRYILYLFLALGFSFAAAGSYDDFFRAVVGNDGAAIRELVGRGFDPNARDPDGHPAIMRALRADSADAALTLAQLPGTDVNVRNKSGETPLMIAAIKGQMEVCKALIERGAAVNQAGWTPLHYAASSDSLPVLRLLLERRAAVDARAPNGRTPLMQAAMYGSEDVVDALLAAGADSAVRDPKGASADELARGAGRARLAERLAARAVR